MSIELTLDASISFGRRQSTRLWSDSARSDVHEQEKYDFLALITAIANLYSQNDILEMQGRQDTGKPLSNGAVSEVSTIYAAVTRPSTIISHQTRTQKSLLVVKRSESKLFHPDGRCNDKAAIRSFISEIQILSHRSLRQHPNIVKILGVHWDYRHTVCSICYPFASSLLDTDPFGVLLGIPRALDPPRESKYGFEKVSSQVSSQLVP